MNPTYKVSTVTIANVIPTKRRENTRGSKNMLRKSIICPITIQGEPEQDHALQEPAHIKFLFSYSAATSPEPFISLVSF
jgi:hypothetical protein